MLNRRDALKAGGIGAIFGFLFRGRLGALQEDPIEPEQKPSAATITCTPQRAFRPERLMISGTVIGRAMVAVKEWRDCPVCGNEYDEDRDYEHVHCTACDDLGGELVETGEMREEDVRVVPWIIEDILIGGHEQFAQAGEVPGDMFAVGAPDAFVSLDAAQAGTEIRFRVRYTGDKPQGEIFRAALMGRTFDEHGQARMSVLSICSGVEIVG